MFRSLEYYINSLNASFGKKHYIGHYNDVPTFRNPIVTRDLYVCTLLLCDQFSEESIASFTPHKSYRYDVPYEHITDVLLFGYAYE